jgi:hypothetical protein
MIGNSQADASGAEARGYAEGKRDGQDTGFAAGRAEGTKTGLKRGQAQGRKAGFADGRERGVDEGRRAGYASGFGEGRSTALGGLSPGWYVVRVGQDENGPVIASSASVAPDAGECYTVSGATVLSGPC